MEFASLSRSLDTSSERCLRNPHRARFWYVDKVVTVDAEDPVLAIDGKPPGCWIISC
jgi:hypothetical protein